MQEEETNPVNAIRSLKRSDLRELRNKHKELLLGNKRLGLHEVYEYIQELNVLLTKLKQKSVPVELLRKVRNSCVNLENIEAVFRNDCAFNAIMRMLISNDAQKQLEAAACLTNLSCGPHKCSYKIAKAAGAYLVSFINGSSHFLRDQSAWTLANIGNDCVECFNRIKSQGALPALLKALSSSLSDAQSVVFAINTCTRYEDPEVISLIQSDLTKQMIFLLEKCSYSSCMFLDAAFTISNCCFFSAKYSLNIFDERILEKIMSILLKVIQDPDVDIVIATPLLRCIGFLSYSDKMCEYLASHVDLHTIIQTMMSTKDNLHLIKETLWIICNISVFTSVFDNPDDLIFLFDALNKSIKIEKSLTIQVLYCLSILVSKHEQVSFLLTQHEILYQIKCLLESEEDVTEAVNVFLELYHDKT